MTQETAGLEVPRQEQMWSVGRVKKGLWEGSEPGKSRV